MADLREIASKVGHSADTTITFRVEGMMCQNSCGTTVTNALLGVPGVVTAKASFAESNARVTGTACVEELIEAVEMVGFDASVGNESAGKGTKSKGKRGHLKNATASQSGPLPVVLGAFPANSYHGFFDVGGMSCSSCSAAITRQLKNADGIYQVNVALLAGKLETVYDPARISEGDIAESVISIGFSCKFLYNESSSSEQCNSNVATTTYDVSGMSCAACAGKIEKGVGRLPGVVAASVNFMTHTLKVKAEKTKGPGTRDIVTHVRNLGYEIRVKDEKKVDPEALKNSHAKEFRGWQILFISSLVFAIPIIIINMIIPVLSSKANAALEEHVIPRITYKTVLLFLLATPIQFWVGARFHRAAWRGARHCNLGMDFLVSLGTSASYIYSVASVLLACMYKSFHGQHFFESSALLLTFVVMGKLMESYAKGRTSDALSKLLRLQAKTALIVEGCKIDEDGNMHGGQERMVDVELVQLRDIVKVLPGATVPADGTVVKGRSTIDESMISGESMPVTKIIASGVYGGTINSTGILYIRITRVGQDTALAQILRIVEEAQTSKAPIEKIADRISGVFAPTVIGISVVTFFVWYVLLSTGLAPESWVVQQTGMQHPNNFVFSFLFSIAVLVVACPCALGLATPTAVMVGTGVGAANGILIKGGNALEMAHRTTAIIFDKTGTLTMGKPDVTHATIIHPENLPKHSNADAAGSDLEFFFSLVASAELGSEHPLGAAIVKHARVRFKKSETFCLQEPLDIDIEPGLGIKAVVEAYDQSFEVTIGNRQWMQTMDITVSRRFHDQMKTAEEDGATCVAVGVDGKALGIIGLSDTLKADAVATVKALKRMGVLVYMVTGDNARTARKVAEEVGIDEEFVTAEVLPQNKSYAVKKLQSDGHVVAMVGDGINDSPALAEADIGIALGQGSEIAIDAADIVLVKDKLEDVAVAMHLSRHVFRRILLNFLWAMGYNTLGIPLAAGVFYPFLHIGLPPKFAGLAMAFSSVSVVTSSLHLKYYKRPNLQSLDASSFSSAKCGGFFPTICHCFFNCFSKKRGYQALSNEDMPDFDRVEVEMV